MSSLHPRISVNSLCFPGAGLGAMGEHWRAVDPQRVSFVSNLLTDDLADARAAVDGFEMEAMTHLFFNVGPLVADEEEWQRERSRLDCAIDAVAELGGRSVYLMTGGRGAMLWEDAAYCFAEAVAPCLDHALERGVDLLIETAPALYADGHLSHSLRDTVILAELAGVGVCLDLHACWAEAGLRDSIERAAHRTRLVQVSDYVYGDRGLPCRAVPGDGNIPLATILDWILATGYDGTFDLELIGPRIDAEGHQAAARRSAEVLTDLLGGLGA